MKHLFKYKSGLWLFMGLLFSTVGLVSCSDDDDVFVPDGPVTLTLTCKIGRAHV